MGDNALILLLKYFFDMAVVYETLYIGMMHFGIVCFSCGNLMKCTGLSDNLQFDYLNRKHTVLSESLPEWINTYHWPYFRSLCIKKCLLLIVSSCSLNITTAVLTLQ